MLEEEKLPWIMLWDKEGFPKNNQPNQIQAAYGFSPFLSLWSSTRKENFWHGKYAENKYARLSWKHENKYVSSIITHQ